MSILGKYLKEDENEDLKYKIPAVFKNDKESFTLTKSVVVSTALHPLAVLLVWLFIFVAGLLGISFAIFNKPETKPRDIEFVLVDKEDKPINKNTRFRSDRNSRAGGIHNPKKKISMPKSSGGATQPTKQKQKPQPQPPKQVTKQKAPIQQPAPVKKPVKKVQSGDSKEKTTPAKEYAPTPAPRPAVTPSVPKVTDKPKSSIVIPVPKSKIPQIGTTPMGTGPITSGKGTGTGSTGNANVSGSSSGSGLSFAPTTGGKASGSQRGTGSGVGKSTGSGIGNGNVGNPGPGNPSGRPGIDAIKDPDFGPYMRDLQQRIKRNWDPPKGQESRRVVLLFTIAKDGRLLSIKVSQSSGLQAADRAALSAVQISAPFRPLPADYRQGSVDIQFTFDYNVFAAKY